VNFRAPLIMLIFGMIKVV